MGQYVRADTATLDKTRLGYARLMIEVQVGQEFPDKLFFNDEHGRQNCVLVEVVVRPTPGVTAPIPSTAPLVPTESLAPDLGGMGSRVSSDITYAAALSSPPRSPSKESTKVHSEKLSQRGSPARGPTKADIKWFLHQNKIGLYGLVETKVKSNNFTTVLNNLGQRWYGINNNMHHPEGRVWVIWLPQIFNFTLVQSYDQQITVDVTDVQTGDHFWFTVVYGSNSDTERLQLWQELQALKDSCNLAWCVGGDFNAIIHFNERVGSTVLWSEIEDFGLAEAPVIRKSSFRYFNMWGQSKDFPIIVQSEWAKNIAGGRMFQVVTKLKHLKNPLKALNKQKFSDIDTAAELARQCSDMVSAWCCHRLPMQQIIRWWTEWRQASACKKKIIAMILASLMYHIWYSRNCSRIEGYVFRPQVIAGRVKCDVQNRLSQCSIRTKNASVLAWVEHISYEDENTGFFHRQIKARHIQNKVLSIKDIHGTLHKDPVHIESAFLEFYNDLLGTSHHTSQVHIPTVRTGKVITAHHSSLLLRPVTPDEIKQCIFSIPSSKAPGPDGYSSQFFKDSWAIIGNDICAAITEFFNTGQLLKQLNATLVTLIPKVPNPTSVLEFRPIACCNIIYKCIAKLLCARLSEVLPDIISPNQGGFIKGRNIVENVLICQDLVRLCKRKSASPRCLIKIDLRKAYNTIEWSFLHSMLVALKFPNAFIDKIMTCVTTTAYSLSLNGNSFGFFKGKRWLRQGDPLSPLLFTICMEYLSRILSVISSQADFRFHPLCHPLRLNHLLFADDLLLFSKGTAPSIMWMLKAFSTFSKASGLCFNRKKSDIYFNGVSNQVMADIIQVSGFRQGTLPFRYFGVPISSHKLSKNEGLQLTDRITARIRSWGTRQLSYSGRLALINSVLTSLHSYWASMFLIPNGIMNKIESICRNFLWSGKILIKGRLMSDGMLVAVLRMKVDWEYTVSEGYNWMRQIRPKAIWRHVCWNIMNVPKWSFIFWAVQLKRLLTKDRMMQMGFCHDPTCYLCLAADENHDHLFYNCPFSLQCISSIQKRLGVHFTASNLSYWAANGRMRSKLQRNIIVACHVGVTYAIWNARNKVRIDAYVMRPDYIVKKVIKDVVMRFWAKNTSGLSDRDVRWIHHCN
ncbi:uncharacterized protein LOC141627693 [Silene latifolia]|uniref:uncharacterized protein LOC141627693 n=1 Tax=Silene latifolia TaxID=37657 RepID=UPI003D76A85F